ncbi:acetyltransferase, GNAT family [Cordyceps militaris CM01]|uniref:Acetyltransferase, GNAT family n=1 Tax=Cordyceps militaris (strain CM01) TaxID=983644 RepID=G3JLW7_CORMM|nr:acetyltransferase, GNAT family [Cordyceps militaris CM01]EGX90691.1 acetyltransferase, GNAT family [Cordyceps militaris CM01]
MSWQLPCGATMRPATTADIPSIVDVYMDSFRNEIFSRQAYPRDAASSLAYWTRTVQEEMAEPDAVWFVVAEPAAAAANGDTVQGFLKWTLPGAPVPEPDSDGYPPEGPAGVAAEYYARVMGAHAAYMGSTPHWYLDMMGVRPACQGRGYAKALVGWGCARAREDGCAVYVDATGDARGFYERMGFAKLGEVVTVGTPQGDAEVYLMLWKP